MSVAGTSEYLSCSSPLQGFAANPCVQRPPTLPAFAACAHGRDIELPGVVGPDRAGPSGPWLGPSSVLACLWEATSQEAASSWFDKMATIRLSLKHIAVERIFALGATNAVTAEWGVVETDQQGRTYRASGVTVLQARDGKLVRVRDYIFDLAPLEEAWRTVETTTSVA